MNNISYNTINQVEKIASMSKIGRLLYNPYKYFNAILFSKFIYPKNKIAKRVVAKLFYGKKMLIALPAATDIYLTGGKSHSSEIRLVKLMFKNLDKGDHFLDIGAHYGYFTLIASEIVGTQGKVFSFEPASDSFNILGSNVKELSNIDIFQQAVSNNCEPIVFYEFPNKYSEYNTTDVTQFEQEHWYQDSKPRKVQVLTTNIDELTKGSNFNPKIIKIDVEGAEYSVIAGGASFLKENAPLIIMEYLEPKRHNKAHQEAADLLFQNGFKAYTISSEGELNAAQNVDEYLLSNNLESDNIVFKKS